MSTVPRNESPGPTACRPGVFTPVTAGSQHVAAEQWPEQPDGATLVGPGWSRRWRAARPARARYSASTDGARRPRQRPAAGVVGQDCGEDRRRGAGRCRSTPPEPTQQPDPAQVPATGVAAHRDQRGERGQPRTRSAGRFRSSAGTPGRRTRRSACAPQRLGLARREQPLGGGRRDHPGALQPDAEIALDRAAVPQRAGDLGRRRRTRVRGQHRVDVGRGPAHVHHEQVAVDLGRRAAPPRSAPRRGSGRAPARRTADRGTAACRRSHAAGTPRGSRPAPAPG